MSEFMLYGVPLSFGKKSMEFTDCSVSLFNRETKPVLSLGICRKATEEFPPGMLEKAF